MNLKTNEKNVSEILKNAYKEYIEKIRLIAILNYTYSIKKSNEVISLKTNNMLNSLDYSINRINPRYNKNEKKYNRIKDELEKILEEYEKSLQNFAYSYDKKIFDLILNKLKSESKLMMNKILKEYYVSIFKGGLIKEILKKIQNKSSNIDEQIQKYNQEIKKIKVEIKNSKKEIEGLNKEKIENLFKILESGNNAISTQVYKRRKISLSGFGKFLANRFNTYNSIMKNVIQPLNDKINQFKIEELKSDNISKIEYIKFKKYEEKIDETINEIFKDSKNKQILEDFGIIEK